MLSRLICTGSLALVIAFGSMLAVPSAASAAPPDNGQPTAKHGHGHHRHLSKRQRARMRHHHKHHRHHHRGGNKGGGKGSNANPS